MRLEPNTLPNAFSIAIMLQLSRVSFRVKNKAVKKNPKYSTNSD